MSDQRPTPETDAASWVETNRANALTLASFSEKLERQRDEARKEAAMWKANHDNQVKLKAALMDRPDLGDRARKVVSLAKERDEAREIAKELRDALTEMVEANGGVAVMPTQEARKQNAALKEAKKSLTKAKEVLG